MITLVIAVGAFAIECVGSNCYPITLTALQGYVALGLLESIFEIPKVIQIWRKKENDADGR